MTFQNFKPTVYCINLDREIKKYIKIEKNFGDIFEIIRVSAIDGKINNISGETALLQTNINLFRSIINSEKTDNYLIVIEDDIYKYDIFDLYWPKIFRFINNTSFGGWDFISLDNLLNFEKPKIEIYNSLLYKIEKSRATGFMVYNIDFLKKNIEYLASCNILDLTMKQNTNFTQLIPNKVLVRQIVDKISGTSNCYTSDYNKYYEETDEFLNNYFIN